MDTRKKQGPGGSRGPALLKEETLLWGYFQSVRM